MKQQEIQTLLDKYFAGESSLQEEAQLRHLLQHEPLTEDQLIYQEWFQMLEEEADRGLDEHFDGKIMERIETTAQKPVIIRKLSSVWIMRIAAVFALISLGLWWMRHADSIEKPVVVAEAKVIDWSKYEPKTPEEAFEATRKALRKVATEFSEGTSIATQGIGKMEEMGRLVK